MNITQKAATLVAAGVAALFASVPQAQAQTPQRSPEEIDQIVGPIALYPDPLVSVVLPAATMPDQVQNAAQLVANGDTSAVDQQSWDDSVRAVAHYPDLVLWMSDNIDWTAQLGVTFATQPADVLNSVQRLRARARAVGTLVDTPQQRVVLEGELIAIVPVEPAVIYVPRYDPTIVYINNPPRRGASVFTFSAGFALGAWLTYDFDWHRHSLYVADRSWAEHRDWSRSSFTVAVGARDNHREWREWRPAPNRAQVNVNISRTVVRPQVMSERTANSDRHRDDFHGDRNRERDRVTEQNRTSGFVSQTQPAQAPQPAPAATQPAPIAQVTAPAPSTTDRTANTDERRIRERHEQAIRDRQPEPRMPDAHRGVLSQNPERPNVAPQPPPPQPAPPATPKVAPQSPTGALSANEQHRERERSTNEPVRRPTPRGSITAGSSREFNPPAEATEKKETMPTPPPPTTRPDHDIGQRRAEERSQRPDDRPPVAPQAQPPGRPESLPVQVKTPVNTDNVPKVQTKSETEDEKAKQQKEENEKKKKQKPDDSNGS